MKSKLFPVVIVAAFVVGACFPLSAFAWEKGNFKVSPSVKSGESWDSNIFYDPNDEKSDFITSLIPGLAGELGFGTGGKHKLKADYKTDIGWFAKYDDQNYANQDALGELKLDLNDYTLTVNNRFLFTSSRAGTEFERRNLRKEDTFNTILGAEFNKVAFDFGYSFFFVDYHSDLLDSIDRYENSAWTTGYLQIMPKTKALLEYKYTNLQYPDATGRDGNANEVLTGLKGDFTAKLTGTIKGGYKIKTYEDSSNEDFSSGVVRTALDYKPTDRISTTLQYEREGFESTYSNNNFYTGDHVLGGVNYKFGGNFVAKAEAQYFFNDYPEIATGETEKRQDHIWGVGGGLDYNWKKWLVIGAGYRFNQRESNIGSRDYDQHLITTDVKLMF